MPSVIRKLSAGVPEIAGSMRHLEVSGLQIEEIAKRHGFSRDAVAAMFDALVAGGGRMAQFRHTEFGGSGQWMRGGMTMVSDMFDAPLKARIDRLCEDLSRLIANDDGRLARAIEDGETAPPHAATATATAKAESEGRWWPDGLGVADSAGSQNDIRYAYFASSRRLAVDKAGALELYDTLDHRISGVSQHQPSRGALTFSSQHGTIDLATLPKVSGEAQSRTPDRSPEPPASRSSNAATTDTRPPLQTHSASPPGDVLSTIEKLAGLHANGVLSDTEFAAKKTELLGRL